MRMWMVNPNLLCRQHLLGEHKELHMLAGSILRGRSIAGHLSRGQLDPSRIRQRHDALVIEMTNRGYNHRSPLPEIDDDLLPHHPIDVDANIADLQSRCPHCRQRINTMNEAQHAETH